MNIKAVKYLLVLLVLYYVIATATLYGDVSFVLLVSGILFLSLVYKNEVKEVFLISFLSNVLFGCIIIEVFKQQGSFFDVGGDDAKFYRLFIEASDGDSTFLNSRYGNYIYLGATYIKLLKNMGINSVSPLLVYPLNWFIGANVCVSAYLLARRFDLDKIRAKYVACLLAIYPFFIFHEVKILRDIFAALLLILFILIYVSKWKWPVKVIGLSIMILVCAKVRGEYILYMILYGGIDLFFNLYYSNKRYQAYILAFVGVAIVALSYNLLIGLTGREAEDLGDLADSYQNTRDNTSGSLGAQLKNMGPLFSPIIILYMWLTPFPPPVLHAQNNYTLIISLGVVFWYISYFRMPFFISSFYKRTFFSARKIIVSKLLVYVLMCSTIISLISADARHLIAFYPLMFIVYEILRQEFPEHKVRYMKTFVALSIVFIITAYAFLKFL